jgi:mRNA interferase RelE/StbE
MSWTVTIARPVQRQVARFPVKDQNRVAAAIRSMAGNPFGGDVLKLEGENNRWRRRVGSYRIFFAVDHTANTVAVSAIVRRTSNTY